MYFIYAIFNKKHNKIYIGQTENLEKRISLHNGEKFKNSYTSRFDSSWVLIYSEKVLNRKIALLREKELKSYKGRQFIKQFIPQ
ncbi:MAG: GIY-YIG nuclease family protein [Patescibacteria group bacterium]